MGCGEIQLDPSAAVGVFLDTHYGGAVQGDVDGWHLGSSKDVGHCSWHALLNMLLGLGGSVFNGWNMYIE